MTVRVIKTKKTQQKFRFSIGNDTYSLRNFAQLMNGGNCNLQLYGGAIRDVSFPEYDLRDFMTALDDLDFQYSSTCSSHDVFEFCQLLLQMYDKVGSCSETHFPDGVVLTRFKFHGKNQLKSIDFTPEKPSVKIFFIFFSFLFAVC